MAFNETSNPSLHPVGMHETPLGVGPFNDTEPRPTERRTRPGTPELL